MLSGREREYQQQYSSRDEIKDGEIPEHGLARQLYNEYDKKIEADGQKKGGERSGNQGQRAEGRDRQEL